MAQLVRGRLGRGRTGSRRFQICNQGLLLVETQMMIGGAAAPGCFACHAHSQWRIRMVELAPVIGVEQHSIVLISLAGPDFSKSFPAKQQIRGGQHEQGKQWRADHAA